MLGDGDMTGCVTTTWAGQLELILVNGLTGSTELKTPAVNPHRHDQTTIPAMLVTAIQQNVTMATTKVVPNTTFIEPKRCATREGRVRAKNVPPLAMTSM